ncbi:hypothetical protein LAWI1_G006260 [Lachnellula willkommii]|uniref:Uncharacterized protein n=1 Tax=Lachnellula willkommii TaxID=215461 RepID=A0A559M645_9HELO|nr:hypothetical protein LAWI1_G006260 [Lachnellula willkommii]
MDNPPETPQQQQSISPSRTLQADFSWKKWKVRISAKDDPESKPVYIINFPIKPFQDTPSLVVKSAADDSTVGTGTLHPIPIDAACELHGQAIELKAQKRFKAQYMHLSHSFSDTGAPVPMYWTSNSGFTTWDFVCLDQNQLPVAKFSAAIWAVRKIANIEFLGEKAMNDAVRDEIVVTGITLYCCMLLRCNNVLSLVGAIFSRPGHDNKGKLGE